LKRRCVLSFLLIVTFANAATATTRWDDARGEPGELCIAAIAAEERRTSMPRHLMGAIALAESGRWDARRKATVPWPWTIMAEGKGQYFPTKQEAIAAARAVRARGVRNIDVGCMQINMLYHGDAFADIEEAFDPAANVAYAARFLRELHAQMGSWHEAAGRYHSATPEHNQRYKAKIARLLDEQRGSAANSAAGERRDTAAFAPAERGSEPASRGRTIIPVDYDRMARLASAWRERQGRPAPAMATVTPGATQSRPGIRDARAESTFAANRTRHLDAWREASGRLRAEKQVLSMK
jgi:hypothetical protein